MLQDSILSIILGKNILSRFFNTGLGNFGSR
jgi:hypothetical protein